MKKSRCLRVTLLSSCALLLASTVSAGPDDFKTGEAVKGFGPTAPVPSATPLPDDVEFKVAFDVAEAAADGNLNRSFESAARLLNMHAAAGLAPENTQLAIVVHGGAAMDLTGDKRYGSENPNKALIAALIDAGVTIQLCGQTAAYRNIAAADLLPGVTMQLSAMTAHALLQQKGFTLNPF